MAEQVPASRRLKAVFTNTKVLIGLGLLFMDAVLVAFCPPSKDRPHRVGGLFLDGDDFQKGMVLVMALVGALLIYFGARWVLGMLAHGVRMVGRIDAVGKLRIHGLVHVYYSYEVNGKRYKKVCSARVPDAGGFAPGQEVGVYVNSKRPRHSLLEADFWGDSPWR
jgi:hypothetical protein